MKYEFELTVCPACEMEGFVHGTNDVDYDVDFDDGVPVSASMIVKLHASSFSCGFCGLNLANSNELEAAGIPLELAIEDADPLDFYDPEEQ